MRQNVADITNFYTALKKNTYFCKNKKAVITSYNDGFCVTFKNTHYLVVEAMHYLYFLRIFKISEVRQHAESGYLRC